MPSNNLYGFPQPLTQVFPAPIIAARAPTTSDYQYPLGQEWVDSVGQNAYILVNVASNVATWAEQGGVSGPVDTLTGDSGGAIGPTGGTINVLGTANQITSIGSGHTITWSLIGPYTPATYTSHGVLVGAGTSSIVALTAGSTGQVLIGSTGANPAFGALGVNSGLTSHGVLLGENNSALVATTAGSNGQVLLGSTGADPAFGTLTSSTGVTFTTGAASLAIDIKTGGFAVSSVAGTSSALAVQTAYVANNASQTTFTLPATAVVGAQIIISGGTANTAGWKIAQNSGQTIHQNASASTTGATGTVTSAAHACETICLMCITANTDFVVLYASDTLSFA